MNIYCDSSTKEACLVYDNETVIFANYNKVVTNNVGEYKAVLLALEWLTGREIEGTEILTDSQLVVNQVNDSWKCRKEHLLPYRDKVRALLEETKATLSWIPREENLAGRMLDRKY